MTRIAKHIGALLVVVAWSTTAAALDHPRAVDFGATTYIVNRAFVDQEMSPPNGSTDALMGGWFNLANPPHPDLQGTIVRASFRAHQIAMITFVGSKIGPLLEVALHDLAGHFFYAISKIPFPVDLHWHYLGLAWSLAQRDVLNHSPYTFKGVFDRVPVPWTATHDPSGAVFRVPYPVANLWTIGADENDMTAQGFGFFGPGNHMANLFWYVGSHAYLDIGNPYRRHPGLAQVTRDGTFGPSELGKGCTAVFGPYDPTNPFSYDPMLCMVGGIGYGRGSFVWNHGGDTSFKLSPNSRMPLGIPQRGDPYDVYK